MSMVALHGFGGGGTSLNFEIIPYATEEALLAATPAGITIGTITETKITFWIFSASEPAETAEGTLWIATGKTSALAFNALKKNTLMVYPLNAKQYISGQWVRVETRIYMNGVWTSLFSGLFYESGVFYTEHTSYLVPDTAVIEENAASIDLSTVAKKTSEVYKVFGPVPLDDISTLAMTSAFTDSISGSHRRVLYVAKSPDVGYEGAEAIEAVAVSSSWTTETTITLDVSGLTGEYYVYAGTNTAGSAWDNARTLSITKVTGEDSAVMAAKAAAYDILTEGVTT